MVKKINYYLFLSLFLAAFFYFNNGTDLSRSIASLEDCSQAIKGFFKNSTSAPKAYFSSSDAEHAALMLDLIKKEQKSISIAYYQADGNKVGNVLFAALADAASRGVKVRLILDAWNPEDWIDTPVKLETLKAMSDLGVEIKYFNNIERNSLSEKILSFLKPQNFNRMHDKVAIFESQNFLVTGDRMPQNSNFRIQKRKGATVRDENNQVTYSFNYLSVMAAVNSSEVTSSSLILYEDLWKLGSYKKLKNIDETKVEIRKKNLEKFLRIAEEGEFNNSLDEVYQKFKPIKGAEFVSDSINKNYDPFVLGVSKDILQMLREAQEEIVIFSPYMNYTAEYLKEINLAMSRGVKVVFIVPSWESIDTPLTLQLWEKQASELQARGAKIIQHKGKDFMHAKIAIVDRKKSFIGSYNFNPRSTFTDHESGLIVDDLEFGNSVYAFKTFIEETESTPFSPGHKSLKDKILISIVKKLISWSSFLYRQF